MSIKLHLGHLNCDIVVNWNEYPRLLVDAEYIVEGGFTCGKDIAQLESKINNTIVNFSNERKRVTSWGKS